MIVDRATGLIICAYVGTGRRHDFHLFKSSDVRLHKTILALVDSGYQGMQKLHANTAMPQRRSKKNPLTQLDNT